MRAEKPWCCFIPDEEQSTVQALPPQTSENAADLHAIMRRLGCQKPAEWDIYAEGDPPDIQTQACTEHVGELLNDGKSHRVWPVEK